MARKINKIILHCSDSDNPKHDDICVINQWHLERKFKMVGYHYFITSKGEIQRGRPDGMIGAHVKGHNKNSIGICLSGKGAYPWKQIISAIKLIKHLKKIYGKNIGVYGHYQFNSNKQCPCMSMNWFLMKYNQVAPTVNDDVDVEKKECIQKMLKKKDEKDSI